MWERSVRVLVEERHISGDDRARCVDFLRREPNSVLEAAAILIGSLVSHKVEKLTQQIPVYDGNLDDVEVSCGSTGSSHSHHYQAIQEPAGDCGKLCASYARVVRQSSGSASVYSTICRQG
ncbi:hypothetical protein A0H81_02775 [Grifola frondosa]|uniref:Uncharacterized protein n=1 Tax=Grifola frondosa TaxID=5627 RepID=A0A1C7MMS8_GRIFR|nr:hypothetical protein A0H81_02775 [Grifola frondosa]